jgi:glutaredoxin
MTIKIYSSPTCAPCAQLKKYLDAKGLAYEVVNADDEPYASELVALAGGQRLLPTTLINDKHVIRGLNYGTLNEVLNNEN